ncbi:hypothetical protein LTR62_003950 [Meristemomyces frigidus]|uniref:Histidine acid phosphatase n=1 Tax=Meristemomyces frigidus TaxID=1508187 RepID=A0AAN7TEB7_9PEZI|nr:hypothetical protein LTR62_003950 [Meristemomyces frigidus]
MLALFIAVLATIILTPEAVTASAQYTVWSSTIFSRTGERTPEVLGYIPTALTSYGANQAYRSGAFFRDRYIASSGSTNNLISTAPLQGLSANTIEPFQVYFHALDEQYSIASAQAFVQGLYPPNTINSSAARLLDPTSILSNSTYVESPLDGYQYPEIHTSGGLDAAFPFLGGSLDCPAFDSAATAIVGTADFATTEAESKSLYQTVGQALLSDVLDQDAWDYFNAYAIYDYLSYQYAHNATAKTFLDQPGSTDKSINVTYMQQLRWLADQQQYAQLGNLNAVNNYTGTSQPFPGGNEGAGSISSIAGNMLAAKILAQMQLAIQTEGLFYKLSVLFGDFEPLLSFFALARLPALNSNFYGLPDFGSVIVFELFSYANSSAGPPSFPAESELWVRFYFRNGTGVEQGDESSNLQSYPVFGRGPSETDMMWSDFQLGMDGFLVGDVGTWCTQCGAENIFCAAWNSSDASTGSSSTSRHHYRHHGPSRIVSGVIGAIVALGLGAIVFAAFMLIGGLRFHRVRHSRKSDLGGFKGGQKMASDRDLTLRDKGGAVVGASVVHEEGGQGHERVGSWELRQKEAGPGMDGDQARGASFESEMRVDPFRDPVKADERV